MKTGRKAIKNAAHDRRTDVQIPDANEIRSRDEDFFAPECRFALLRAEFHQTLRDKEYELGDEAEIKLIGMFKRSDGDHKFIVVEAAREIDDFSELSDGEKEELSRLYHRVGDGEGWFGRQEAEDCVEHGEKPL